MERIIRDYELLEKIGEGGMGAVYKARDTNLDREVAIKAIHPTFTSNVELVARFRLEAKLQAGLVHPNIIAMHNFFCEADMYYMVMEYVDGETLAQRIKRVGLIPPHLCIPMFTQMLEAVQYAHERHIIHRDIKPSNMMITKDNTVKVMDFGIAKLIGEKGLTKTGTKMGTIYYMSPEQVMGEKEIDARSDIFSLGITFFEMLSGQLPYRAETSSDFKVMQEIVNNFLPSVKKYYPYVPEKVDRAIETATKKDPRDRFQSCREFAQFIEGEQIDEVNNYEKKKLYTTPPLGSKRDESRLARFCSACGKENTFTLQIPATFNCTACGALNGYYDLSKQASQPAVDPLNFPKANLGNRLGASILDGIVLGLPWVIVIAMAGAAKDGAAGIVVVFGIPLLIFSLIKDGLNEGRGIAKKWVGLRIIKINGETITKGTGFIRMLVTAVYSIFYFWIVDIILVFANNKGRKLADFIVGVQVVNEDDIIVVDGKASVKGAEAVTHRYPAFQPTSGVLSFDMMKCPFCGEQTSKKTQFCERCGRRK